MQETLEIIEKILKVFVEYAVIIAEIIGCIIIVYTLLKALIDLLKKDKKVGLNLAKGLSLSLSFLLCGEALHSVIITEMKEFLLLAATMALRAGMSFLLHWEMKEEEKEINEEEKKEEKNYKKEQQKHKFKNRHNDKKKTENTNNNKQIEKNNRKEEKKTNNK